IKKRGRSFEKKIETSYLEKINVSYKKGLKKIKHVPQFHIEIEKYKKTDLPMLVKQISERII
ncbi:MAG: deoxynucleoside kinase, partial [Bacteroidia bacterium]|nr:deoxynucleoside kinase [Bacteroidia bacterium]